MNKHIKFMGQTGLFGLALACALNALAAPATTLPPGADSPLLDKAVPAFTQGQLDEAQPAFTPQQLKGKVWVLNVWASWCGPCRKEHPLLVDLAKQVKVPIVGLNHQDQRDAGKQWLAQHGNPYTATVFDGDGQVGATLHVIGVPETFVVDAQGRVRYKVAGPLTPELIKTGVLPWIRSLQTAKSKP